MVSQLHPQNKVLLTEIKSEKILKNNNETNTFLQDKLNKLEVSDNLKRVVSSGLIKTNNNIKKDFNDLRLEINKQSNDINLIMTKRYLSPETNYNFFSKETLKHFKYLKTNEEKLKNSIAKLEVNKKIILDESQKGIKGGIVEENIRNSKLNIIENQKENLISKLKSVNDEIERIIYDGNKKSKKEIISKFLDNFEKDKEDYKIKVLEYEKNAKESKEKMKKDKKITYEKREKEFKEKEKEDLEKKEKLFNERKEKEHQIFLRRKKEIDEKLEKTKQYINEKFQKSEKDYLYYRNKEKFEQEENKLIEKINLQKKEFITKEELINLEKKRKEQKEILEKESKEKKRQLKEMWNNRSQLLPIYKSKIALICEEYDKEKYGSDEIKKQKIMELERERLEYAKNNIPKPIISNKLKKILSERNKKINKNSVLLTQKNNKKRIDIYYISPPKKRNNQMALSNEIKLRTFIDEDDINNLIVKKPKKYLKPIHILHPKPEKLPNYLSDFIKNREEEGKTIIKKKKIKLNSTQIQTGDIYENIKLVKIQTEALDNELQQKKEFMKLNGGYQKNPKIGDQLGSMLIESIQSKLDIINKLNGN